MPLDTIVLLLTTATKLGDVGLVVWFSLWVREVPGSTPGRPRHYFFPPAFFFCSYLRSGKVFDEEKTQLCSSFYFTISEDGRWKEVSFVFYCQKWQRKRSISDTVLNILSKCTVTWGLEPRLISDHGRLRKRREENDTEHACRWRGALSCRRRARSRGIWPLQLRRYR